MNKKTVIIIVGIVLFISFVYYVISVAVGTKAVSSTINNAKSRSFIENAKTYVNFAQARVDSGEFGSCQTKVEKYSLEEIDKDNEIQAKSPFGGNIDENSSYVRVTSTESNGTCDYEYEIYMTDGIYSIGTKKSPIKYDDLSSTKIQKK